MSAVFIYPERAQRLFLSFNTGKTWTPCHHTNSISSSPQLCIIWLHNTMSVFSSSNTSMPCLHPCLFNAAVSQLAGLRQFLVSCVNCALKLSLPVGVWVTLLSGVGDARQLEQLKVHMLGTPVSIVWSLHIVGVSDVMTLNAVLACSGGLVQSGTTLTSRHWRRWRSHGHTAGVGKWIWTFLAVIGYIDVY